MITRILTIISLLLLILTGCADKHVPKQSFSRNIDWSRETPATIKARVTVAARQLDIMSAFFQVNMNPPLKKMMSSMAGVITIDARKSQPKVRIRTFHLFGSILFDMALVDNEIKIYIPSKKLLYVGRRTEQKMTDNKGPQTIFANMMIDPTALAVREDKEIYITPDKVRVFLENGWFDLAADSGLIMAIHRGNLEINYSAYKELGEKTVVPTRIIMHLLDGSFRADCTLSRLSTPRELPADFFDLVEYKPVGIKDLRELENN
jgi:hypothetical protein